MRTSGHEIVLNLVQFSKTTSVPLRLTVAWIWGQKPLVFVKHHSPQLAQPQLFTIVALTVWHITGSGSMPMWKALKLVMPSLTCLELLEETSGECFSTDLLRIFLIWIKYGWFFLNNTWITLNNAISAKTLQQINFLDWDKNQ